MDVKDAMTYCVPESFVPGIDNSHMKPIVIFLSYDKFPSSKNYERFSLIGSLDTLSLNKYTSHVMCPNSWADGMNTQPNVHPYVNPQETPKYGSGLH